MPPDCMSMLAVSAHFDTPDARRRCFAAPVLAALILTGCGAPNPAIPAAQSGPIAALAPLIDSEIRTDFGLPFVAVEVRGEKGSAVGTFILDTGFDDNIIDADWAKKLGVSVENPERVLQPGGEVDMGRVPALSMTIAGRDVSKQTAQTAPIHGLSGIVGIPIQGLIGHELLDDYVVRIDYRGKRLQLFDRNTDFVKARPDVVWTVVPVRIESREVLVPFRIQQGTFSPDGGELKLDTGSFGALGFALNFYESAHLEQRAPQWRPSGGVGAGGNTEARIFQIDTLHIFDRDYRDVPAGVTMKAGGTERRDNAGTIGSPILSRQDLVLDYPRNRILIGPEYAPGSPVSADRSGLWLVTDAENMDHVLVHQVVDGSPAQRAGIQTGDRVLTINGTPVAEKNLGHWFEHLRQPQGTSLRLEVQRGDQRLERSFELQPLF